MPPSEPERVKLPEVDEHGNLPPGIHDATLEEIERVFGSFQRSGRRPVLMQRLKEYVSEAARAGWRATVIIDGSFVMSRVDEPEDIDVILVLPSEWDMAADLRPFEYNLISKKRVKKKYGFDVFAVRHASVEYDKWTEFFSRVNVKWSEVFGLPTDLRKGLVRVVS
jgi:hypothetical protein